MSRKALVTRPQEDSAETAEALRQRGYEPVIEPLLAIHYLDVPVPDPAPYQGVLITSANGARALARQANWRDLPVWAVGEASAAEARRLGFVTVRAAGGDVAALADLVGGLLDPGKGKLLHVAATRLAGDLAGLLSARGFGVDKTILYEAVAAEALTPALCDLVASGGLDVALFFSPRTAATFVTLARRQLARTDFGAACALALSPAVADALRDLAWRDIKVAPQPSLPALLGLLDGE